MEAGGAPQLQRKALLQLTADIAPGADQLGELPVMKRQGKRRLPQLADVGIGEHRLGTVDIVQRCGCLRVRTRQSFE